MLVPATEADAEKLRQSDLEAEMLFHLRVAGLPRPETEYVFDEERNWRFDGCWPPDWVAYEVQGGIWKRTRTGGWAGHAHPERIERDYEKHNAATLAGFTVYYFTPAMVQDGRATVVLGRALRKDGDDGR